MQHRHLLTAAVALAAITTPAHAGDWKYTIAPYFEMSSMNGSTGIGANSVDVDVSFGEVWKQLDFGIAGNFNAQNDVWAINLDGSYAKLSGLGPNERLKATIEQGVYAGIVARRFSEFGEIYGGVRVVSLTTRLSGGDVVGTISDANHSWVDPIIGVRITAPLTDRARAVFMIDGGGFGIGADVDVQIWPNVTIDLDSAKRWQAMVGYRFNYFKYNSGSGDDYFAYDMLVHGPLLGVAFTF
jgi:hypothetical protein